MEFLTTFTRQAESDWSEVWDSVSLDQIPFASGGEEPFPVCQGCGGWSAESKVPVFAEG